MNENVKKELDRTINRINKDFSYVQDERLSTDELIKMQFDGIRILVNYCENLALRGEEALK